MKGCASRRYSMLAHHFVKDFHFFLNHGISVTLRGTRSVEPFLPSEDLDDLKAFLDSAAFFETFFAVALVLEAAFFAAAFVFETVLLAAVDDFLAVDFVADFALDATFFAVALVLEAAFFDLALVATVAFFAAAFVFETVFLAAVDDFLAVDFVADFALDATFFAAPEALSITLAAAPTFFATAALRPAFWSFLEPAEATLETVSIFALTNFFAVAAPIPGSAVNASIFELPFAAIGSPITPWWARLINSSLRQFVTRRWIDDV